MGGCMVNTHTCSDIKNCIIRKKIAGIRSLVDHELSSITLDAIIHKD